MALCDVYKQTDRDLPLILHSHVCLISAVEQMSMWSGLTYFWDLFYVIGHILDKLLTT